MQVLIKLRHYEKASKFEKNLPLALTKQTFLLGSIKTSGRFFQIFVVFSEKLNFTEKIKKRNRKNNVCKKKVCKSTQQCIICCLRPDILSRQKKNQRRFQGAPLECTNYILFLKKNGKKIGGRCVVANTLAEDICFKNSSKFLMELLCRNS